MAKKKSKPDRWHDLCELVKADDGLPTRESGYWAEKKLRFWNRYLEITTTAMVGNPAWPNGLIYVDLFSGPGICAISDTKKRIAGSPLIAANTPKPFSKILLVERDVANAAACSARMEKTPAASRFKMFNRDCNDAIDEIVKEIPLGALTLAFIDPTGLHAHFETIRRLSERRADLLILFPDAVDIVRNVDLYLPQLDSNLDRVLGPDSKWRDTWKKMGNCDSQNTRRMFADTYRRQLKDHLRYEMFMEKVIEGPKGPLYRLVFASKHSLALKFWEDALKADKQKPLEFD